MRGVLTTTHRVISYTYDSLYRLTDADYSSGESYQYAYDPAGNRLSLTTHADVVNYAYDDANRLTSVNGQAYTWDDNGNLLNDGLRSYTYDHANRLTQVVSGTLTTHFAYNGVGDRISKTVDSLTTAYVLDPAAGLTQVLQETTAGQTTSYLYGHDLLAQYDSGTWAYHVNDGLGSVRQLTDPTGQVVASYSFSPFGVPLGESGGEPYGFTGEQWDASTGLVYLRARYYDANTGRFLTKDLWPGDQLWPQMSNPYVYLINNPINLVDPSGLQGGVGEEEPDGPYWWEPQGYTFVDFLKLFLQDPQYAVAYTLARRASLPDTAGVGPFRRDLSATIFQEYARGLEAYIATVGPPTKLALESFPLSGPFYEAFQAVTGEDVFFGTEYSPRERYLKAVWAVFGSILDMPGVTDEMAKYGDDIFIRFIKEEDYYVWRDSLKLPLFNERDLYATTPEYLLRELGECPERSKIAEKLIMNYDNTEYFVTFRGRGPNKAAVAVRDIDLPREMTWLFPSGTKLADISDAVIIGAHGITEEKLTVELLLKLLALQPGPP